jgi:hypothetical protein
MVLALREGMIGIGAVRPVRLEGVGALEEIPEVGRDRCSRDIVEHVRPVVGDFVRGDEPPPQGRCPARR